ncbi:MAG TPA: tetratricopeptide repeat protein, partial [Blastocatellia bacterium]|nr:tetratricopeptide repeat protein [Blastocatellia bacterium]
RESLARATEARLRRIRSLEGGAQYSEDDATHDLAQAYLRGAVLAFHIYGGLTGLEQVGISIEDYFDQMIATTKFDREAERPKEFEATVARVAARRAAASKTAPADSEAALDPTLRKIIQSSDLIRQRRFAEAKPLLEEALKAYPNNARALFGMAQVVSQTPSAVEQDPKKDEDDKIQAQYDRFKQAVKLFRNAIDAASPESERWIVQWSHVFIGRILDFQDFRADAVQEYEKAIALGDITNGAYKEAQEGKRRPFGKQ